MVTGIAGRKLFFLINPKAGMGKVANWWKQTCWKLDEQGLDYAWEYTLGGPASSEQTRRAVLEQGARAVIAVGGDGSLYDAVNGLVRQDLLVAKDVLLAACPAGSGCDFARFVYGKNPPDLLDLLHHGQVRPIDLGRCRYVDLDGKERVSYYINSFDAGAGADTCLAVNAQEGRLKKILKGKLAFMLSALRVLMSYSYTQAEITFDQEQRTGEYIIMAAGNGQYMGGGMKLFPMASLDDGKLDLLVASRRSRLSILWLFAKVYDGSLCNIKDVVYRQVERVCIRCGQPIAIELDGEVPGITDVELSVLPKALPFLFPAPLQP